MTIGFTGTQLGMTRDQHHALQTLLQTYAKLPDPEFHHGDCVGSDSLAASTARDAGFRVIGHPPLVPYKRTFFDSDETLEPKQCLARNRDIVDAVEILIATPKTMKQQVRSGTWATIRYARARGVQTIILPPAKTGSSRIY